MTVILSLARSATAVATLLVALSLTSCGLIPSPRAGNDRTDHLSDVAGEWVLDRVFSSPEPLVEGVEVRLTVAADRIALDSGCNEMGGPAALEDSRLVLSSDLFMTEVACADQPVMDQEEWLYEFLQSRPIIEHAGAILTVNTDADDRPVSPDEYVSLSFSRVAD